MAKKDSVVPAGCPLSVSEYEIARMVCAGMQVKQIAVERNTRDTTIRTQLGLAYRKLDVYNMAGLVAVMNASGWLDGVIDTEFDDQRITPAQGLYIKAFDRWLRDPTEEHADERAFWLRGMYYECDTVPPWEVLGIPQR